MPAGAVTLVDIQSVDWSLELDSTAGDGPGSGIGNVVQGLADINQCIAIILTTPKGTDPFRPDFACDVWKYVDKPLTLSLPQIVREVTEAITKWEPRVTLISVVPEALDPNDQGGAHLSIDITWQLALGGTVTPPQTTTVTL